MSVATNVNIKILPWAIQRAGYDLQDFIEKMPRVEKWINGDKAPTIRQLEGFSKKVHIPFGYLFLKEPPKEKLPIPFFRTGSGSIENVSINVYDTILLLQQRQNWLKEYLKENASQPLPFVGLYKNDHDFQNIVKSIRETLNLTENWASNFSNWEDATAYLVQVIEDQGIITVFNGVVENNTHRPISVDECRGFVLVDELAPFMFVNNADSKAAQMFTIVHELAHVWTGQSAGFDFRKLQAADDPIEKLCDRVAAEFLVPSDSFNKQWSIHRNIKLCSRYFKVSEIVIARRALDTQKISRKEFFQFYDDYRNREFLKKEKQGSGGDFYATSRKRLSVTFAAHINQAVKSGQLLYRDAYKLTSMKGDTFEKFFTKHY